MKTPKGKGPKTPNGTPKHNSPNAGKGGGVKSPNFGGVHKQKTPKKPMTPNVKAGTPKSTPTFKAGTPKPTPNRNGTPKPKTPKENATPKTQNLNSKGTPKPQTPKSGVKGQQKPPKTVGPGSKGTPKRQTPKSGAQQKTPNIVGRNTPKPSNVKSPKILNENLPKGPKANKVANEVVSRTPLNQVMAGKSGNTQRKRSASAASLDEAEHGPKMGFKTVRVYNLPKLPEEQLIQKVKALMEPRGVIEKVKYVQSSNSISVQFNKAEEARAAKKLSGVLLGGKHLTVVHSDDRSLPTENRIVISNVPIDLNDEDIWSLFGSCGKILSIHMNRDWRTKKVQRCFVTFDTKKAVDSALSSPKECRKKLLVLKTAGKDGQKFPIESTVYIVGISTDVTEDDVRQFLSKSGPVLGVVIVDSKKKYAMAHMKNESDVEKALTLTGKDLNGVQVRMERHRKSPLYVKPTKVNKSSGSLLSIPNAKQDSPSPAKKLKLNNGNAAQIVPEEESFEEANEDDSMSDDEGDLLATFQSKMQKLKSGKGASEDNDDEDEEGEDEEDDSDEEDDDAEEEEDEDDDGEEDEDDDGEEDEDEDDSEEEDDDDQ